MSFILSISTFIAALTLWLWSDVITMSFKILRLRNKVSHASQQHEYWPSHINSWNFLLPFNLNIVGAPYRRTQQQRTPKHCHIQQSYGPACICIPAGRGWLCRLAGRDRSAPVACRAPCEQDDRPPESKAFAFRRERVPSANLITNCIFLDN